MITQNENVTEEHEVRPDTTDRTIFEEMIALADAAVKLLNGN